mmetsp:Transcript_27459/g.81849  ORF Transcript_27459/g.81849 Transcript_27459/m.81849 type:complete len:189 (-) Transcript_27459:76-642(-)
MALLRGSILLVASAALAPWTSAATPATAGDAATPDMALAADDECLVGSGSPSCAVNALQARTEKAQAAMGGKQAAEASTALSVNASTAAAADEGGQCSADTTGSCVFFGCRGWRGPTKCERGRCICSIGYCAQRGICVQRDSCSVVTSGTCNIMSCAESRGATECRGGKCVCKSGYCVGKDSGSCVKR